MPGQAAPNRNRGTAVAVMLALAVAGPVRAQPAGDTPAPPTPPVKMTGATAWQQLVGNTIVATSRDGGYTEFYAADGAVTHLDQDGKSTGKWSVAGDKVCFDFPEEDDRSCVSVELEGGKGAFVDEDNTRDRFDVSPGNAKHL